MVHSASQCTRAAVTYPQPFRGVALGIHFNPKFACAARFRAQAAPCSLFGKKLIARVWSAAIDYAHRPVQLPVPLFQFPDISSRLLKHYICNYTTPFLIYVHDVRNMKHRNFTAGRTFASGPTSCPSLSRNLFLRLVSSSWASASSLCASARSRVFREISSWDCSHLRSLCFISKL